MQIAFDIPEEMLHQLLDSVRVPMMARVRYAQPTPPPLQDVTESVRGEIRRVETAKRVRPGQRVAVAVGSRGISHLPEVVAAVVSELRQCGANPFIVPAMGSHGGATAGGQEEILKHLLITEERVDAPVESCMDTVIVGYTSEGMPVHIDRLAAAADAIVLVARVKPHTAFHGPYESGLAKMLAIGLGKQVGAAMTHARGFGEMARMVPDMARVALTHLPPVVGIAVVENAHDMLSKVLAIPGNRILADEPELLAAAREGMPRLPFDHIDVLVIDQIGKNISGDGADPNVTGRYPTAFATGGPEINKQVVLDLTAASGGNANGIGTADFTTVRVARQIRFAATYPNALTSTVAGPVKLPMVLPSDLLAFQAAILTCNAVGREPRIVRIRDTLSLVDFSVSEAMIPDVRQLSTVSIASVAAPAPFNRDGNLTDLGDSGIGATLATAAQHDVW